MTDMQIFTLAVAIVVPLAVLLLNNSRMTDMRVMLQASIAESKDTLRAEIAARHNEQMGLLNAIMSKLDGMDTRLTALEGRK
jgi:low affinity Fe/Cu permease